MVGGGRVELQSNTQIREGDGYRSSPRAGGGVFWAAPSPKALVNVVGNPFRWGNMFILSPIGRGVIRMHPFHPILGAVKQDFPPSPLPLLSLDQGLEVFGVRCVVVASCVCAGTRVLYNRRFL